MNIQHTESQPTPSHALPAGADKYHTPWLETLTQVCRDTRPFATDLPAIEALRNYRYDTAPSGVAAPPAALTTRAAQLAALGVIDTALFACSTLPDADRLTHSDLTSADNAPLSDANRSVLRHLSDALTALAAPDSSQELVKLRRPLAEKAMDLLALIDATEAFDDASLSLTARTRIVALVHLCEPHLEYSNRRDDAVLERLRHLTVLPSAQPH